MYNLAINSLKNTNTKVFAPKRNDRKMLSFNGGTQQFQHLANENQMLKDLIESDNFDYIRTVFRQIKTWKDKQALQDYKVAIEDLRKIIQKRIEELIPSEKIKNARYINNYKIGKAQVIKKDSMTPVTAEFTKDHCQYYAFIDSIKTGEIILRPSSTHPTYYAHSMESFDNDIYKGVGTKFHQLGVEKSLQEGYGGRVRLDVTDPGAKLFHYKFGFRKVDDENKNFSELIESVISGNKPISDIGYKEIKMHLPEEEIQRIIETQIKVSPIIKK